MNRITLLTAIVVFCCGVSFPAFTQNLLSSSGKAPNNDNPLSESSLKNGNTDGSKGCEYSVDDGGRDTSIGITGGGDILWLNSFSAQSGCENIFRVSIAFGNVPDGTPVRIILYEDPNDDGNPNDAIYLTEVATVVANSNIDIFNVVDITPTFVSGEFFVAAVIINQFTSVYPAAIDQTIDNGVSWVVGTPTPGMINIMDLTDPANTLSLDLITNYGYPGNWLLRAEGTDAISTPVNVRYLFLLILVPLIVIFVKRRIVCK